MQEDDLTKGGPLLLYITHDRRCTNIEISWNKYRGAPAPGAAVLPTPMLCMGVYIVLVLLYYVRVCI